MSDLEENIKSTSYIFEFSKHMTTLSSTMILILAGFGSILLSNEELSDDDLKSVFWGAVIIIGLFVLPVISSTISMISLSLEKYNLPFNSWPSKTRKKYVILSFISMVSFVGGIILITLFAAGRLTRPIG